MTYHFKDILTEFEYNEEYRDGGVSSLDETPLPYDEEKVMDEYLLDEVVDEAEEDGDDCYWWWGYLFNSGQICVKRYLCETLMCEAYISDEIIEIVPPFEAKSEEKALEVVKGVLKKHGRFFRDND